MACVTKTEPVPVKLFSNVNYDARFPNPYVIERKETVMVEIKEPLQDDDVFKARHFLIRAATVSVAAYIFSHESHYLVQLQQNT